MGRMGGFSVADMKKLKKQLDKIQQGGVEDFVDACAKELAARLLAKVIKRTPVGDYSKEITVTAKRDGKKHRKGEQYTKRVNPSGKKGGTLRRGWTSKTQEEAESGGKVSAKAYAESLVIHHFGDMIVINIVNPVEYASYVESGHRTANHKGWVMGKLMLAESKDKIQSMAPKVLESKIKKFLMESMK